MKNKCWITALCIGSICQANAYAATSNLTAAYFSADYLNTISEKNEVLCRKYDDEDCDEYISSFNYARNNGRYYAKAGKSTSSGKYILGGIIAVGAIGGVVALAAGGGGGGGGSSASANNATINNNSGNSNTNSSANNSNNISDSGNTDSNNSSSNGSSESGNSGSNGNSSGSGENSSSNQNSETVYDSGVEVTPRQSDIIYRMRDYLSTTSYTHKDSDNFHFFSESYFRYATEYDAFCFSNYEDKGTTHKTLNFLDPIRAAKAYSYFYGYDNQNNVVNKLNDEHTVVAILDTGVYTQHAEFLDENGNSKVTGANFDYGPCLNGDTHNCWLIENYEDEGAFVTKTKQKRTLYIDDAEGNSQPVIVDNDYSYNSSLKKMELEAWADMYPDDYDWDEEKDNPNPLTGKEPISGSSYAHGTHVAGIVAANWNRTDTGMMGVAFSNTDIFALRWDMLSPMNWPIDAAIESGAIALNMSVGSASSSSSNASMIANRINNLKTGALDAAYDTIRSYNDDATDGMIWVMSAGNERNSEPTILAGIKNLGEQTYRSSEYGRYITTDFSKLMMLIVVSVNVEMNSDGTVDTYYLSKFSNKCGSTAAYCIAAPGGDSSTKELQEIYSTVSPSEISSGYAGMYGTSQATPIVTASIAFMKSAFPFLYSSEIIDILIETANTNGNGYDHSTEHADKTYGAGLLDLGKAVSYYIPPVTSFGTLSVATLDGASVNSAYVDLSNTNLTVTASMADALASALPEYITVFDRYRRPFEVSTARYISFTHSGYKALKNDVNHIVPNQRIKHENIGNINFTFAEGALNSNNGLGFMDVEYQSGKNRSGFFFSENTHYKTADGTHSDMNNPFMSFTTAYGAHYGYDISPRFGFKLQAVAGRNGLYDGEHDYNDTSFTQKAYAVDSEINFKPLKKLKLAFSSGMLYEDEALLGMNGSGAFGLPHGRTYYTGVKASWQAMSKLTLSGSYYQGYTEAQAFNSNMLHTTDLISNSFAFDINYKMDKSTDFGFRISSPLRVEHGKLLVDFASGRDYYSDTVYRNQYAAGLKPQRREYKFAWYANKVLSDNLSISSEFDVRVNPEHRASANDYRALFGLAWNF